ncbi:MAG: murein transglycosylase A [Micavibrio aeruginosavorus]|uniref:peptidoglycan lytic exotransglycosylase n=1 Tax=Micavibrio aeruginosavorus TaxID=349221 RepID=A0A7T5R2T8_9BACT|nr:MAG: murein transglycosylase A [Micavibrio aeruginosavorus]
MKHYILPSLLVFLLTLSACATTEPSSRYAPEDAPLVVRPVLFSDLPGWGNDDLSGAIEALGRSCSKIMTQDPEKPFGDPVWNLSAGSWSGACGRIENGKLKPGAFDNPRAFFEFYFTPYEATAGNYRHGLFTGYYEAALKGSRAPGGPYQTALLQRPDDLIMVELGDFRETLKGQRIAGRVVNGSLKPYETRAEIETGKLLAARPLVWVDDPVGAFFLHIQGSGRILLDDGGEMRVGYAAQNGHMYYAIGRELVKRGLMVKEDVSMQSIRAWLESHPSEAKEFMNLNPSYIFFKEIKEEGPLGAQNVPLTAGRSLAVDRTKIPYGLPLWLDILQPIPTIERLQRLVIAQDTGGAIKGPIRGDYFWGYGEDAEHNAGLMKATGRYWLLLPRVGLD